MSDLIQVTGNRKIPTNLAAIGELHKIEVEGGQNLAPKGKAVLCTDGTGKHLYVVAGSINWQKVNMNPSGSAADMAKTFHGTNTLSKIANVTIDTEIPSRLKSRGRVTRIEYKPLPPSPKAGQLWYHEMGDMGPGQSGSVVMLGTAEDGTGAYLIVVKRGKGGAPYVNSRGIVG